MSQTPKPPSVTCHEIMGPENTKIYWTGKPLEDGPLPAFFYFSLSGNESLCLDPYNQPVAFLSQEKLRTFSLTLPAHGKEFDKTKAMRYWADAFERGEDPITPFLEQAEKAIYFLMEQDFIDSEKMIAGGLSRGAFIATHLAARISEIKYIIGFAPLTNLVKGKDFSELQKNSLVHSLSLHQNIEPLVGKEIRFYIGNRDLRVGTDLCFDFIRELAEASYEKRIRSPKVEMIISPSVGFQGHGTSPNSFYQGAEWVKSKI